MPGNVVEIACLFDCRVFTTIILLFTTSFVGVMSQHYSNGFREHQISYGTCHKVKVNVFQRMNNVTGLVGSGFVSRNRFSTEPPHTYFGDKKEVRFLKGRPPADHRVISLFPGESLNTHRAKSKAHDSA